MESGNSDDVSDDASLQSDTFKMILYSIRVMQSQGHEVSKLFHDFYVTVKIQFCSILSL